MANLTTITSPATWINGAPVAVPWLQQVQDGINALRAALIDGTQSLGSLALDGVGNAAAAPSPGQISVRQSVAADTPTGIFKDSAGNVRSVIDHNGYPLGRYSDFRMEWLQLSDGRINAAPSYVLNNPTSTYPSPFASATGGTATTTNYFIDGTQTLVHGGANFLSVIFEAEVAWSTITATNTTLGVGLSDSFSVAAPGNAVIFQRVSGGTNWQGLMTGSAAVPLGVAPVVNTVPSQRLRIEVHGSTSPYGSGANGRARFFVNEALVGEVTGVVPSAALLPVFGVTTGGSAPNVGTNPLVGPFRVIWNRLLSLPAL